MKDRNLGQITNVAFMDLVQKKAKVHSKQPKWMSLLLSRFKQVENGSLKVILPNYKSLLLQGSEDGHDAIIYFRNWSAVFKLAFLGELSFAEAYVAGDIEIADLDALFNWYVDNEKQVGKKKNNWLFLQLSRITHKFKNNNTKSGSKKNISFHYDLGNEFYQKWLDQSMTYSSGIYDETDSLEASQYNKYQRIIDQLDIKDGDRVLEIGCGWGGFADQLLSQLDVDYEGVTISQEQLDFAKKRMAEKGKVDLFEFLDYRDVEGQYDHIVSIEMFEAVGENHWQSYFDQLKALLKPTGSALIQVITIEHDRYLKYRNRVDFIQKYIFPGGMLPSEEKFEQMSFKNELLVADKFEFGLDYGKTLEDWKKAFKTEWGTIKSQGFDDQFFRLWLYYLDYCRIGFERKTISVVQYQLKPTAK